MSILNQSGASYPDAKLKLIAGDVHRAPAAPAPSVKMMMRADAMAAAEAPAGFEEKAFFEYHLYTLGRPTTLPDRSTKQIELFPTANGVACETKLVYQGGHDFGYGGEPYVDRFFGAQGNRKVEAWLEVKNGQEQGLGVPLPAGRVRVSKLDPADGSLEFIGEDRIDHTPRNETLHLKLGNAFDVVGERKQTDFRIDLARKTMSEEIEIRIRNRKAVPVKVQRLDKREIHLSGEPTRRFENLGINEFESVIIGGSTNTKNVIKIIKELKQTHRELKPDDIAIIFWTKTGKIFLNTWIHYAFL